MVEIPKYSFRIFIVISLIILPFSGFGVFLGNVFGTSDTLLLDDVYRIIKAFDLPQDDYKISKHASASEDIFIDSNEIKTSFLFADDYEDFISGIRRLVIGNMIEKEFDHFNQKPYYNASHANGNNRILLKTWDNINYELSGNLYNLDDLDSFLYLTLSGYDNNLTWYAKYHAFVKFPFLQVPAEIYQLRKNIFLFKNKEDIESLGYKIVSQRSRQTTDRDYRRYNIKTAFANLWNVRVLNPGETFSFLDNVHYNSYYPDDRKIFAYGYAIMGNTEQRIYGGGLCGAASAAYQWVLTHKWLEIVERRWHTIWYKSLFEASVNGFFSTTPGLDATVFRRDIDFVVKNIRSYPIILVFNYDGEYDGIEEVFAFGMNGDQGNYEFQKKKWLCYYWDINGEIVKTCYRKIE